MWLECKSATEFLLRSLHIVLLESDTHQSDVRRGEFGIDLHRFAKFAFSFFNESIREELVTAVGMRDGMPLGPFRGQRRFFKVANFEFGLAEDRLVVFAFQARIKDAARLCRARLLRCGALQRF